MKGQITELLTLNYAEAFIAFVIIGAALIAAKEGIERFAKTFGIELTWVRRKKEMEQCQKKVSGAVDDIIKRQDSLEEFQKSEQEARQATDKEILEAIKAINSDIDQLGDTIDRRFSKQRFRKLRYDILNFANKISSNETVSGELIAQVYREIHEYNTLCEKYGFKNHRVTASVEVIQKIYQDMILNGKIKDSVDMDDEVDIF